MQVLAEHEKEVLHPARPGFEHLMYKGKDVVGGGTLKPEEVKEPEVKQTSFEKAKVKESFFYPNEKEKGLV